MLTIYKASAGSGKTHRLAYEYVKLLLGEKCQGSDEYRLRKRHGLAHRSILAVTFTNKATEEMKQRIVHELAVLADMEPGWTAPSGYLKDLTEQLHCSADELKVASREALEGLLNDFGFFQVSTIDSFFQSVLRAFAYEADLTGNYDVDLEDDVALRYGVHRLFSSLGDGTGSADRQRMLGWIKKYLLSQLSEGKSVNLFNRKSSAHQEIVKFVSKLSDETYELNRQAMEAYLADDSKLVGFEKRISELRNKFEEDAFNSAQTALAAVESSGFSEMFKENPKKLLKAMSKGYNWSKIGSTVIGMAADPITAFKIPKKGPVPDSSVIEAVGVAAEYIALAARRVPLLDYMRSNVFALGLFDGVIKQMEEYRSENNLILLSDTNTLLRSIIGDSDTPFVYERMGVWLQHFLIDEFQDTSKMQWQNMLPLLRESQSQDCDNLIIGDEKQCIYRFRSSDPTLLQHGVEEEFPEPQSVVMGTSEGANTNWRSSATVVEFNNTLFEQLAIITGNRPIYGNVRQGIAKAGSRGYVQINGLQGENGSFTSCGLEIMGREMERQLKSGYKASDILVLVRYRSEGKRVIDYLLHRAEDEKSPLHGIRVVSEDVLMLDSSPAVKHIISKLRAIASPDSGDDAEEKYSPRQCADMINRFDYYVSRGVESSEALRLAVVNPNPVSDMASEETERICYNLPSLVEAIIRTSVSGEFDGQQIYVSSFQDVVDEFCATGTGDIHSFLNWWDECGSNSKVSAPENEDAVRVMTIHKSKGLEARCLHLPLLNTQMVRFKDKEWFAISEIEDVKPDLVPPMLPLLPAKWMIGTQFEAQYSSRCNEQRLDELNVLYVAFTRAKDEIIASYMVEKSDVKVGGLIEKGMDGMAVNIDQKYTGFGGVEVHERCIGEPTVAGNSKAKPRQASDPQRSFEMPEMQSFTAEKFWNTLRVDDQPDLDEARGRGVMLHDVMCRVIRPSDLHKAVVKTARRYHVGDDEAREMEKYLGVRIKDERVRRWFEGFESVMTERTVLLENGLHRRPDRVVWYADGSADVVDYKFGSESDKYNDQVASYVRMLQTAATGPVRGYLWYVDSNVVREVPQASGLPFDAE